MHKEKPIGAFTSRAQKKALAEGVNKQLVRALKRVIPENEGIIDLGAGAGLYVMALKKAGYIAHGYDGTPGINRICRFVDWCDLLMPNIGTFKGKDSCALLLNVGHHIPREHEGRLLDNVARIPRRRLVVSWKQDGKLHNGRTLVYIASELSRRRWDVDDELTRSIRKRLPPEQAAEIMVLLHHGLSN